MARGYGAPRGRRVEMARVFWAPRGRRVETVPGCQSITTQENQVAYFSYYLISFACDSKVLMAECRHVDLHLRALKKNHRF